MASQPPPPPRLSEDEIDDLVYLARTGEDAELADMLAEIATRESAGANVVITPADVLQAARDDGGATCLHMAAANGHSSECVSWSSLRLYFQERISCYVGGYSWMFPRILHLSDGFRGE